MFSKSMLNERLNQFLDIFRNEQHVRLISVHFIGEINTLLYLVLRSENRVEQNSQGNEFFYSVLHWIYLMRKIF